MSWPAHDTARLTEAFRRAVLRLFVRLGLFDEDQAAGMLAWPHSGFHVHTAVGIPEDDHAFAPRRWAALLRQIVEVDPLRCPHCAGAMRIVACITHAPVLDQILTHLRTRAAAGTADARPGARSPPASPAPLHAPCGS